MPWRRDDFSGTSETSPLPGRIHAGRRPRLGRTPCGEGRTRVGSRRPPFMPACFAWFALPVTAMWMWARADLRRRWRSWVVLGLLAGITVGIAAAGVAGARRTADATPNYARKLGQVDAAVLANDPRFDATERAKVAALPE